MQTTLNNLLERFHKDQNGAVLLLVLAAFLVLFMVAMTLYDAGQASQDKMRVQTAADTAAYSHSVVKARTMNVIVYANIIKRFFYSYLVTYVHAWVAIIAQMAIHAGDCFKLIPNPKACYEFFAGLPMVIAEGIEAVWNLPEMGVLGSGRAPLELNQLEFYQQYMFGITPWWAWIEAAGRAMNNGAMISASWPPPPSGIGNVKSGILRSIGTVDWVLGTEFINRMPSLTQNTDALPVTRRDRQVVWENKSTPFNFSLSQSPVLAAAEYCGEYALSLEAIIVGIQTFQDSNDSPEGWKTIFAIAQLLPIMGCAVASITYHEDGYLDWRVNKSNFEDQNKWLQSTSNISIAYKPRAGTMDDSSGRKKFAYMEQDYNKNPLYGNEGYFAMARSEIVYKQPFTILGEGAFSVVGDLPILGNRLGLQDNPDMWSPRWKSKNRPVALPGESLGSAVQGPDAGLGTIINDTIPFLIVGSITGIVDSDFSAGSGMNDLLYLYRIGTSMTADRMQGVTK